MVLASIDLADDGDKSVYPADVYLRSFLPSIAEGVPEDREQLLIELYCNSLGLLASSGALALQRKAQTLPIAQMERNEVYFALIKELSDEGFGGEIKDRYKFEYHLKGIQETLEWCFANDKRKAVEIVEGISSYLGDTGRLTDQLAYSLRAIQIAVAERMVISEIGLYTRLGWVYILKGELARAASYLLKAKHGIEEQWKKGGKTRRLTETELLLLDRRYVQVLRDLSHALAKQGRFNESQALIDKSEKHAVALGEELPQLQARLFRAWIYCLEAEKLRGDNGTIHQYFQAEVILSDLQATLEKHPRQLALAYRLQAEAAIARNSLDEAEQYLISASDVALERYFKAQEQVTLSFAWGKFFVAAKDKLAAIELYQVSAHLAKILKMKWDKDRADREIKRIKLQLGMIKLLEKRDLLWDNNVRGLYTDALARVVRRMGNPEQQNPEVSAYSHALQKGMDFLDELAFLSPDAQAEIIGIMTKTAADMGIITSSPEQLVSASQDEDFPKVDPNIAEQAFQGIINMQEAGYGGQPRRKPYLIHQVWDAFKEYSYEDVDLDAIAQRFDKVSDIKQQRAQAQTAISRANALFDKHGYEVEIHRYKKKYRIQPRNFSP